MMHDCLKKLPNFISPVGDNFDKLFFFHKCRDDLKELPYLHYCIKEANRLYPPVPSVSRQLATPRTIEGCQLPKGTPIILQIYAVHHNPSVWNEPEVTQHITIYILVTFQIGI